MSNNSEVLEQEAFNIYKDRLISCFKQSVNLLESATSLVKNFDGLDAMKRFSMKFEQSVLVLDQTIKELQKEIRYSKRIGYDLRNIIIDMEDAKVALGRISDELYQTFRHQYDDIQQPPLNLNNNVTLNKRVDTATDLVPSEVDHDLQTTTRSTKPVKSLETTSFRSYSPSPVTWNKGKQKLIITFLSLAIDTLMRKTYRNKRVGYF